MLEYRIGTIVQLPSGKTATIVELRCQSMVLRTFDFELVELTREFVKKMPVLMHIVPPLSGRAARIRQRYEDALGTQRR